MAVTITLGVAVLIIPLVLWRMWSPDLGVEQEAPLPADLDPAASPPSVGERSVLGFAFTRDRRIVAVRTADGQLAVWDLATATARLTQPHALSEGVAHYGNGTAAFAPDGRTLATIGPDSRVYLWDLATGQPRVLGDVTGQAVAFDPQGQQLAVAALDGTLRLLDAATGAEATVLGAPSRSGRAWWMAFAGDGAMLLAGEPFSVARWDLASRRVEPLLSQQSPVAPMLVDLGMDGRTLAAVHISAVPWESTPVRVTVDIVDIVTGQTRLSLHRDRDRQGNRNVFASDLVYAVALAPDGRSVLTGHGDGSIVWWDLDARQVRATARPRRRLIGAIGFGHDPGGALIGSFDGTVTGWDLAGRRTKSVLPLAPRG